MAGVAWDCFAWLDELQNIIDSYKDGNDEPLDGDEVERLVLHIKAKINLMEGNITEHEYVHGEVG